MRVELPTLDYQYIELLFNTIKQISEVDRTIHDKKIETFKEFYYRITSLIYVYDNTRIDEDDLNLYVSISSSRYEEYLRYEVILKSIDSINLKDNSFQSLKEYHYLVCLQLNTYDFLVKEKEEKKKRAKDFFNETDDEKDAKIKQLEKTIKKYRSLNKIK